MLQRLFKKKSSNPSQDKAASRIASARNADQSIELAQSLSLASQYHGAGQFSEAEAAYRQILQMEHESVEIDLAHAADCKSRTRLTGN